MKINLQLLVLIYLYTCTQGWSASSAWGEFGIHSATPAVPVARAVKVVIPGDSLKTDQFLDAVYGDRYREAWAMCDETPQGLLRKHIIKNAAKKDLASLKADLLFDSVIATEKANVLIDSFPHGGVRDELRSYFTELESEAKTLKQKFIEELIAVMASRTPDLATK